MSRFNLSELISQSSAALTTSESSASFEFNPDKYSLDEQLKKSQIIRYQADTANKQWLAQWAAVVVTLWLSGVMLLLCYNRSNNIGLSDTVLNVLLSTTTLNVLGLMYIVLKGYFAGDEKVP